MDYTILLSNLMSCTVYVLMTPRCHKFNKHYALVAIIRPMITQVAMVWWPHVQLGVAGTLLECIQHLACLAITGTVGTTPLWPMAMEVLVHVGHLVTLAFRRQI